MCLFPRLDGRHMRSRVGLSKSRAVSLLRRLLQRISIPHPEEYSGHSARRGGYVDRLAVPLHLFKFKATGPQAVLLPTATTAFIASLSASSTFDARDWLRRPCTTQQASSPTAPAYRRPVVWLCRRRDEGLQISYIIAVLDHIWTGMHLAYEVI